MAEIYNIPRLLKQLEGLGFYVGDAASPKIVKRFFGGYYEAVQRFTVSEMPASVREKENPRRIIYIGKIPTRKHPQRLSFLSKKLIAYEAEPGIWTRADKHDHVDFP